MKPMDSEKEFSKSLPITIASLKTIWDRIGFNEETKTNRLATFFKKLNDDCDEMLASEEDLEEQIQDNIKEFRSDIRTLSHELALSKFDDKYAKGLSMLEEEKLLREKFKSLQNEKKKRLDEFKFFSLKEIELCDKMKMKPTEIKTNVPTESEIDALKKNIHSLEKMRTERKYEMAKYKNEITKLYQDLDMSQTDQDSFSELIIVEGEDDLPLADNDLIRAKELRDQLKKRDEKLTAQIKALRSKIKNLWTKLNIDNVELNDLMRDDYQCEDMRKSEILVLLNEEHERCLKIKMANMQKFIDEIRVEIESFYEKLYFSDKEIKNFQEYFTDTNYTEDLLKLHEEKIEDLKFKYTEGQLLYEKTARWMDLWEQFIAFEEKSKDPNRFKVRGYNSLDEEKARKQFNIQFPKLEEDLRKHADEYEQTNGGQQFLIYGIVWNEYFQSMRKDYENFKEKEKMEKQIIKNGQKIKEIKFGSKAATPLSKTIHNNNKRKIDCTAGGPQTPSIMKSSKFFKVDDTLQQTTSSKAGASATPTVKRLTRRSKAGRKSRTPMKGRLRQSQRIQTHATNNMTSSTTKSSCTTTNASKYKVPAHLKQQASSTKNSNTSNDTTLTATNSTVMTTTVNSKASSSNASTYKASGYPFRNVNTNVVNYVEFSRDLSKSRDPAKPFKFNAASNGRYNGKPSQYAEADIKNKLTSTLLKE